MGSVFSRERRLKKDKPKKNIMSMRELCEILLKLRTYEVQSIVRDINSTKLLLDDDSLNNNMDWNICDMLLKTSDQLDKIENQFIGLRQELQDIYRMINGYSF